MSAIALAGWTGWPVSAAAVAVPSASPSPCAPSPATTAGFRLVLAGIGLAAAMQSVIQYVFTRVDE